MGVAAKIVPSSTGCWRLDDLPVNPDLMPSGYLAAVQGLLVFRYAPSNGTPMFKLGDCLARPSSNLRIQLPKLISGEIGVSETPNAEEVAAI